MAVTVQKHKTKKPVIDERAALKSGYDGCPYLAAAPATCKHCGIGVYPEMPKCPVCGSTKMVKKAPHSD